MEERVGYLLLLLFVATSYGCQFYPQGEYLRFVRVPESLPVGREVILVEVHPKGNLSIQPVDKAEDAEFFTYKGVNRTHISVRLRKSLEDLVDNPQPQNVLKFRLVCDYKDGDDTIDSYLSLTVYVEDENDHAPEFIDHPYHITIDELTPTGLTLFRGIQAIDRDKPNTPNSEITYSIVGGNTGDKFALEVGHRPALVLKRPLDFDQGDSLFLLHIKAKDGGRPSRTSATTLTVLVTDNDDLNPRFTKDVYRTQVHESYPSTGKRIHKLLKFNPPIEAFDEDRQINTSVRYDIVAGNEKLFFTMNSANGSLYLEKEIDLDNMPGNLFTLQIQATQIDNPLKTGLARVEIEVIDMNDNQPQFEVELYNISIVENLPNGFSVLQVNARDKDQGDNGEFVYHLVDPAQAFSIDGRSGWLTVRNQAKLDRETRPSLSMRVFAREKMPSVYKSTTESYVNVEVTLLDANDNNPMFVPSNLYEFTISNRAQVGFVIGKVEARDPDLGRNGMILYDLKRGNKSSLPSQFHVSPQTGEIRVAESPLPVGRRALFIEASDQPANPSERRFSLAVVSIEVVPSDKVRILPDFISAPYEFWVGDDAPVGTSIGQIRINEALDKNRALFDLLHSYHEGVPFAVEERSGMITVVDEISRYKHFLYDFEAVVTDEMSTTLVTNVTIHIVDSHISNMQNPSLLEFKVRENTSGAMVGKITQTNGNSRQRLSKFTLADQTDTAIFAISQDGTIYTQKPLDRETRDSYLINVVGHGARTDRHFQVQIYVEDANDNAPTFERTWYEGKIAENCGGCPVTLPVKIKATDPDSGANAEFTLSLKGEGAERFTLSQNGNIAVRGRLDRETKDLYSMTLVATDKGNLSSQVRLTIHVEDVNDNPPILTQLHIPYVDNFRVASSNSSNFQVVFGNKTLPKGKNKYITVTIPESIEVGRILGKVLAIDKDSGENSTVTYMVSKETLVPLERMFKSYSALHFAIHPILGELTVASRLPPKAEFLINITAADMGGLKDTQTIRIMVEDVNDNAPVFEKPWYDFRIPEGTYKNHVIGRVFARDNDFDANGNVSYTILQKKDNATFILPFTISESGELTVTGKLDREREDVYHFKILAQDNGPLEKRLRSTVEVNVQIIDTNDNPPLFYGYGRVVQVTREELQELSSEPVIEFKGSIALPIYFATVTENNAPGIPIAKIYANDTDSPETGSGLVLYDIHRKKNHRQFFAIDKEGIVTVTSPLDYETQNIHNVTVVASDLGQPSLSSTALLIVTVIDVAEDTISPPSKPLIMTNYFELEVEENCIVPLELLKINVTSDVDLRFSLVPTLGEGIFKIDPKNGTLYLIKSPDREVLDKLQAKVRVRPIKKPRQSSLIYPVNSDDLEPNEVKVVVRVKDVNDNIPQFNTNGRRPIVVAIPTSASYGYPIIKLLATDADEGLNAEVRYSLVTKSAKELGKFAIDHMTGQVRSTVSFLEDAGAVYTFDVRATDRKGAKDGSYSTANVFVYIIDDYKKLIMELSAKPSAVERAAHNITQIISNITGLEVKVRKLEPHLTGEMTDMYLYAVDPVMNIIVDMETFNEVLSTKEEEIRNSLLPMHLQSIRVPEPEDIYIRKKHREGNLTISSLEFATMALGCIVFIGAITSAFCVICLHKRRKKTDSLSLRGGTLFRSKSINRMDDRPRSLFYPNAFLEDSADSCVSRAGVGVYRRSRRHRAGCSRHRSRANRSGISRPGNTLATQLKASMASVHSSGRDSGIVEPHHACCPCSHSSHSSSSSHGSYEDSLKSLQKSFQRASGSGGSNEPSSEGSGGCEHGGEPSVRRKQQHGQFSPPPLTRTASQRLLIP